MPDVVDESGETVPGIDQNGSGVHKYHPAEFAAYAIRDAEVSVTYLRRVAEFAEAWGLKKIPPTVASIATTRLRNDANQQLPGILGRELTKRGRIGEPNAEAREIQTLAADAYHGGRNEAFVHGIFTATPERPFVDYDLKGCYTTAMAPFRTLDWASIEHTKELSRLAVLEDPAIASIDFQFPEGTRFPCLPVNTGDGGLVYPLSGSTTATGPELLLAVNLGARIIVRAGVRVPWEEPDMDLAERPFRDFAQFINRERAAHAKGQRVRAARQGGGQFRLWQARPGRRRDEVDQGQHPPVRHARRITARVAAVGHHLPAAGGDDIRPAARRAQRNPLPAAGACPRPFGDDRRLDQRRDRGRNPFRDTGTDLPVVRAAARHRGPQRLAEHTGDQASDAISPGRPNAPWDHDRTVRRVGLLS